MNIYRIDERHVFHRCPVDGQPHIVDIQRTVVHVTDTGPCLTPVTIGHDSGATSTVACGRREPHERQCDNCRTVITTGAITTSYHLGIARPTSAADIAATYGLASDPCRVCDEPLAAVLAPRGRHLGCHLSSPRTRPELDAA